MGREGGWRIISAKRNTAQSIVALKLGEEKSFLVLNKRMAISFDISKIATLGLCTAFLLHLFSFQESANDLASRHIAAFSL